MKTNRSSLSYDNAGNRFRNWALVFLFAAALLIIHLVYQKIHLKSENERLSVKPKLIALSPVKFDFYTVLPKMSVTTAPQSMSMATVYFLQIAAVRQELYANGLAEQMRKSGYHVSIQPYQSGQTQWYRVMLGPFESMQQAQKHQAQLEAHHINSIISAAPLSNSR